MRIAMAETADGEARWKRVLGVRRNGKDGPSVERSDVAISRSKSLRSDGTDQTWLWYQRWREVSFSICWRLGGIHSCLGLSIVDQLGKP